MLLLLLLRMNIIATTVDNYCMSAATTSCALHVLLNEYYSMNVSAVLRVLLNGVLKALLHE